MENILTTQGIKQAFPIGSGREFVALHDINIQIPKGKLTMLRGRSGSGKTTLMNILSALDYPKEGTVVFEGAALEQMNDHEREEFRKNNVGFVFQSVALIPMMTAYENVEFLLRLAKYQGNKRAREQQRVAIARAIAHKPKIIFADEPTAELDTATGLQVMKIFKELIEKEEVTIVMTTHDMGLLDIADCIYHLEDGEIVDEK